MRSFLSRNELKIARISTLIILLALIRSIAEPFRLQASSESSTSFGQTEAFLEAALLCSIGLFLMILFSFYNKYRVQPLLAILVIAGMLLIKFVYN